ncbi:MAG: PEP-CTERM sorting domain-containing protein [Gemmatimonadaceae bacterium]|nr:PEP-CTERM sorting domain-containing protein [Gemmatimonadaceae bacterium]
MPVVPRTILFALATSVFGASLQAQLRAYAGAIAGNATIGPQFQCATSGPSIPAPWFTGVPVPTDGIAACGLSGGIDDRRASSRPLTASQTASGAMAGGIGTFTGSAQSRANYWALGVAASGTATGPSSSVTYRTASAFASFAETITYSSPTVANGTAGSTNFSFLIDGMMKNTSLAPFTQQGDVYLSVLYTNGASSYLWNAFIGSTTSNELPNLRGGSTGIPGNFVLSPGEFSGSANITTNAFFQFIWGSPFTIEVALYTTVSPCCNGTSIASNFFNSAVLTGIDAFAPSGAVTDFVVDASSGARLNRFGVIPPDVNVVPEPATIVLFGSGVVILLLARRRRLTYRVSTTAWSSGLATE